MPDFGLDDAARRERCQSAAADPQLCSVESLSPCLLAGGLYRCLYQAAVVWPGSVAQAERCPLRWPVGNERQLLLSSVPDASPLCRRCAAFGTRSCFVNTE